jgi:hypothetical protein
MIIFKLHGFASLHTDAVARKLGDNSASVFWRLLGHPVLRNCGWWLQTSVVLAPLLIHTIQPCHFQGA